MLSRRTEYHAMQEYYTPRIDKNYTYSIKTTQSTSRKGNNYSFGRNDYSTYGTGSYYNGNTSFSSQKCSCRECDYGRLENCTCSKCISEGKAKYSSLTAYNSKKTRNSNFESNKECTCEDEEKSTSEYYGANTLKYNTRTNIGTSEPCRTCGRIVCKCGRRARNQVVHEIKHKNAKKKCVCGNAICTCGARKNKKIVTSLVNTSFNRNIDSILKSANTSTINTSENRRNVIKIEGRKRNNTTRFNSVGNYRRNIEDQCTCGLDHNRLNSENKYVSTVERKYITQIDNLNCTCGADHKTLGDEETRKREEELRLRREEELRIKRENERKRQDDDQRRADRRREEEERRRRWEEEIRLRRENEKLKEDDRRREEEERRRRCEEERRRREE